MWQSVAIGLGDLVVSGIAFRQCAQDGISVCCGSPRIEIEKALELTTMSALQPTWANTRFTTLSTKARGADHALVVGLTRRLPGIAAEAQ
jgi:hypothetical protein